MDKQGIFKYALMSYLPQKYLRHASFEAQEADRLIIDFKSGRKYATERVSRLFAKTLSLMDLKDALHGRFKQKFPRFSMKNSQDFQLPPNSLHIIGRKKRNNMGVSLLFCNFATVMLG